MVFKMRVICSAFLIFFLISCSQGNNPPVQAEKLEDVNSQNSESVSIEHPEDETFIIKGKNVTKSDLIKNSIVVLINLRTKSLCTASILTTKFLLTAAHCVEGLASDLRVSFGLTLDPQNLVKVKSYITSPEWRFNSQKVKNTGDIALVKLIDQLPGGYQPSTLLNSEIKLKDNQPVLLAGYGITNAHSSVGAGKLRKVEVKIKKVNYSETETLIDQTEGKGACHGDSGGPAYVKNQENQYLLWGVTSRGYSIDQNECSGYSIYTRIQPYLAWIKKIIQTEL